MAILPECSLFAADRENANYPGYAAPKPEQSLNYVRMVNHCRRSGCAGLAILAGAALFFGMKMVAGGPTLNFLE